MTEETLAVEPANDALPEKAPDSSPETVAAETAPADAGTPDPVQDKIQRRIDTLTREKYDKAREADYWKNLAMERQKPEPKQEPEKVNKAPTLAENEYDEAKYQAALIEWTRAEARAAALEEVKSERAKEQEQARVKSFKQREAEFISATPDYQEKVYSSANTFFTNDVVRLMAESSDGPAVAYYLANNRELGEQISSLPLTAAAREIGKIEARLEKAKEVRPPVVSKAPAPPPKVDAVEPDIKKGLDDPNLSDKEFAAIRRRQIAQRRNR
jgi:hypothetical protein